MHRLPVRTWLALATISCLGAATPVSAQANAATRSAYSIFLGGGWATLSGNASEGGVSGFTAGAAHELPIHEGLALRTELRFASGGTDLGRTGTFDLPTTISQTHVGITGMFRWSRARGRYLGAGGSVMFETTCDVDTEGGPGFLGGETVSCDSFTDIPLESKTTAVGLILAGGVQRTRLGLEARFEQGINATVESSSGSLTPRRLTLILNYRLRARR